MSRGKSRPDQLPLPAVASPLASRQPKGYQQLIDLTEAINLTPPDGACVAVIQAEGAVIRWRDDGVDPSSSVGMRLAVGAELQCDGSLLALRFIQEGSGAKLNISYYG